MGYSQGQPRESQFTYQESARSDPEASMSLSQRMWLCLPAAAFAFLDGTLTLLGQPYAYWRGEYDQANEFNPVGWVCLYWHPLAFVAAVLCWMCLIVAAGVFLPRRWAIPFVFLVYVGHTLGAASWLANRGGWGWVLAVGTLVLAERVMAITWPHTCGMRSISSENPGPEGEPQKC